METKVTLLNYLQKFDTKESCYEILYHYKWKDGYRCRRCGCEKTVAGRSQFHKRCSSCKYDESCTAHTLFHKLKFPIVKAFAIIFQLATMKKGMSSCEIARQHGIHQETAWFFQKKVQLAMMANTEGVEFLNIQKIINDIIELLENKLDQSSAVVVFGEDDILKSGSEFCSEGLSSRSASDLGKKCRRSKKNYKLNLKRLITHREERAWRSFHFINLSSPSLIKIWPVFKLFNLKNWLRGIHHKVSMQHLKNYLGEFLFRLINRRATRKLVVSLISGFIKHAQVPYTAIIAS